MNQSGIIQSLVTIDLRCNTSVIHHEGPASQARQKIQRLEHNVWFENNVCGAIVVRRFELTTGFATGAIGATGGWSHYWRHSGVKFRCPSGLARKENYRTMVYVVFKRFLKRSIEICPIKNQKISTLL
jgi:hypothetical protein